jgi:hypothetical protein
MSATGRSTATEYYLAGQRDTPDSAQWRTEIGWPVFRTLPGEVRSGGT